MRRIAQTLACVLTLLLCVGCHEDDTRVPVSGTVTQNGQPVKEGKITFAPAEGTNGPAAGASIENGRYRIPAAEGPGTGSYFISVTPGEPPRKKLPMGHPSEASSAESQSLRFTREIAHGSGDIDLELSAEKGVEGDG
jgi:hypothetical protein